MTYHDPDFRPFADDPSDDDVLDADLRALLAEADAAPTLRPSRDLWPGVAARLDALPSENRQPQHFAPVGVEPAGARVLAFRARPLARAPLERAPLERAPRRRVLAAAAVALVALSSGATYLTMRRADTPAVVATAAPEPTRAHAAGAQPTPPVAATLVAATPAVGAESASRAERAQSSGEFRTRPVVRAVARSVDATVPGAAAYDREITELRAIVAERHGELDSATVDVLVRNLHIIDAAIAASRSALARDPHSPFLGEQLTRALGQKVDLLRTVALLPRT